MSRSPSPPPPLHRSPSVLPAKRHRPAPGAPHPAAGDEWDDEAAPPRSVGLPPPTLQLFVSGALPIIIPLIKQLRKALLGASKMAAAGNRALTNLGQAASLSVRLHLTNLQKFPPATQASCLPA